MKLAYRPPEKLLCASTAPGPKQPRTRFLAVRFTFARHSLGTGS